MRLTGGKLRSLILEVLEEADRIQQLDEMDIGELSNLDRCFGSTHFLRTCMIGDDQFYLKVSDSWDFENKEDKTLQIAVEYLAYKIYQLYPDSAVPSQVHLVSDPANRQLGLATQAATGVAGGNVVNSNPPSSWAESVSGGAMVDVFLANHDVANLDNFVVNTADNTATRIDPGGSMTFRAMGARKGRRFSPRGGDIPRMLDPNERGAGRLMSKMNMQKACSEFLTVDWPQISARIDEVHEEAKKEMINAGLNEEASAWDREVEEIKSVLESRHVKVLDHCNETLRVIKGL